MSENIKIIRARLRFTSNEDAGLSSKYLSSLGLWSESCNTIVANCNESFLLYDIELYTTIDELVKVEDTNYWRSKEEKIWIISLITEKGITLTLPYQDSEDGSGYIFVFNSNLKSINTVKIELLSD